MKKICVLFFMLTMGMSLAWFWQIRVEWGRAADFEEVEAVVVANRVSRESVENPDAKGSRDRYVNEHRAEYLLEYSFDGKQYRHWERDSVGSRQRFRVESALGQMAPGTKVRVYVDRAAPQEPSLQRRGGKANWRAIVLGVLGLVLAGASLKLGSHPLPKRMGASLAS